MMLELGPGTIPHKRTNIGLDLHHPRNSKPTDASVEKWPVKDEEVDEVYSSHFMEHVARGEPLLHVMSEAFRVLRPGGTFTMICPLVGFTNNEGTGQLVAGWQPYADPTHVNFWWFPEALMYFCEGPFKPNADYGGPTWAPLGPTVSEVDSVAMLAEDPIVTKTFWAVRGGWEGVARLVK